VQPRDYPHCVALQRVWQEFRENYAAFDSQQTRVESSI
jgi:hypothetical protein